MTKESEFEIDEKSFLVGLIVAGIFALIFLLVIFSEYDLVEQQEPEWTEQWVCDEEIYAGRLCYEDPEHNEQIVCGQEKYYCVRQHLERCREGYCEVIEE